MIEEIQTLDFIQKELFIKVISVHLASPDERVSELLAADSYMYARSHASLAPW